MRQSTFSNYPVMNQGRENPAPVPQEEKIRYIQHKAKTLTDDIGELLDLYYKLAIVTATEKASQTAAVTLTGIIIISLSLFTLLFAGLGLGWYLGEKLDSILAGYSIIAAIFLLLILGTLAFRKTVIFPFIRNLMIRRVYE